jgi:formate dehydrogenase major subunit
MTDKPNTFILDDREVDIREGETIFRAARRVGVRLPHLCYLPKPGYRPDGNCRVCMVEVEGERVLAASCIRTPTPGMKVKTQTDRAKSARKMVLELLGTDQPARETSHDPDSEFWKTYARQTIEPGRFPKREAPAPDRSHPAMAVNLDACIQCNLCVRACREVQVNDVIGMAGRGHLEKIVFDFDDPMGASTCVACGECVQACPTGALMPSSLVDEQNVRTQFPDRAVNSVCPYCGVGCQLTYHLKDDKLLYVTGRNGPANENRLCVKGRFGFDYVTHPHRLMQPLIRKDGVAKAADDLVDPANPWTHFRTATWEEALDRAAKGLVKIRDRDGPRALAGFGSAKGSNEEAYLFQKLVRTGFGSNNVDHCTRLCHASSVAALLEGVGSAAVTATFNECKNSDVIIVIGANPTENHPVAATFFKQAAKRGAKLIVMDPRGQALKRHAWQMMQFKNGTDVAMLNAMLNVIIGEKLYDQQYVQTYTEDFDKLAESVKPFTPEEMSPICGIEPDVLRNVARTFARAESAIIFWGMGVSQHTHGTDNARCLIALSLICGQIGRPGTGLHPLRGQNNVQGASDAGLIPMFFPDYKSVEDAGIRAKYEAAWGVTLDPKRGKTVVEIMDAVHADEIKGMYIMGENPAMSDPDLNHARGALAHLEHLVVQDIFLTETASYADVILPASAWPEKDGTVTNTNRQVQMGRAALPLPGEAGPLDHPGSRPAHRTQLELQARRRGVHRDGLADAGARQHQLGARRARKSRHLSRRRTGCAGPRRRVRQRHPASERLGQAGRDQVPGAGRDARRRVSVHPHHRPPARALAHRRNDAPRLDARCARAWTGRGPVARHHRQARHRARRHGAGRDPARRGRALGASGRIGARRGRVHPVRLCGGGGEPAHQPGARSVRENPRVQVLRRQGRGDRPGNPHRGGVGSYSSFFSRK